MITTQEQVLRDTFLTILARREEEISDNTIHMELINLEAEFWDTVNRNESVWPVFSKLNYLVR
jgi:hypothetical protein